MAGRFVALGGVAAMVAGVLALTTGSANAAGLTDLTLLSWNIQGSKLSDSEISSDDATARTIVKYIQDSGAEYVGLQEVSQDQARLIADTLKWGTGEDHLRTAFEHDGPVPFGWGAFDEGIAMLSKYPMTSDNYEILPDQLLVHPDGRGRKLQRAVINKNGIVYHVYNTHLASDDWTDKGGGAWVPGSNDDENRNQQARWVRDTVLELERDSHDGAVTYLVGGDMNSHPVPNDAGTAAYTTLSSEFQDTWLARHGTANETRPSGQAPCDDESGCTISIRNGETPQAPVHRIDYFFMYPYSTAPLDSVMTPSPTRSADFSGYSDHYPYQVTVG